VLPSSGFVHEPRQTPLPTSAMALTRPSFGTFPARGKVTSGLHVHLRLPCVYGGGGPRVAWWRGEPQSPCPTPSHCSCGSHPPLWDVLHLIVYQQPRRGDVSDEPLGTLCQPARTESDYSIKGGILITMLHATAWAYVERWGAAVSTPRRLPVAITTYPAMKFDTDDHVA
jgi:hypothetical protein